MTYLSAPLDEAVEVDEGAEVVVVVVVEEELLAGEEVVEGEEVKVEEEKTTVAEVDVEVMTVVTAAGAEVEKLDVESTVEEDAGDVTEVEASSRAKR